MMQAVNKTAGEPLWLAPLPPLSYLLNLYDASVRLLYCVCTALKDWRNWLIFAAVYAVMTSPTWAGGLLFLITGDSWHLTYSSAYMAFWALPLTPLIPLCIAITLGIRKLIHRKKPPHYEVNPKVWTKI